MYIYTPSPQRFDRPLASRWGVSALFSTTASTETLNGPIVGVTLFPPCPKRCHHANKVETPQMRTSAPCFFHDPSCLESSGRHFCRMMLSLTHATPNSQRKFKALDNGGSTRACA